MPPLHAEPTRFRWHPLLQVVPLPSLQIVSPHVASFDIAGDGSLVWTNGYDIVRWRDGDRATLGRHELVEAVRAF